MKQYLVNKKYTVCVDEDGFSRIFDENYNECATCSWSFNEALKKIRQKEKKKG